MKLGQPEISLNVKSVSDSLAFYQELGFEIVEGEQSECWFVLEQGSVRIGLYEGHISSNRMTFFCGDVEGKVSELCSKGMNIESGPEKEDDNTIGATLLDPDGNLIYLNS